jgi:hypothetical protein
VAECQSALPVSGAALPLMTDDGPSGVVLAATDARARQLVLHPELTATGSARWKTPSPPTKLFVGSNFVLTVRHSQAPDLAAVRHRLETTPTYCGVALRLCSAIRHSVTLAGGLAGAEPASPPLVDW